MCVTGDARIKVLNVRTGKLSAVCPAVLIILHPLTHTTDVDRSWRRKHTIPIATRMAAPF